MSQELARRNADQNGTRRCLKQIILAELLVGINLFLYMAKGTLGEVRKFSIFTDNLPLAHVVRKSSDPHFFVRLCRSKQYKPNLECSGIDERSNPVACMPRSAFFRKSTSCGAKVTSTFSPGKESLSLIVRYRSSSKARGSTLPYFVLSASEQPTTFLKVHLSSIPTRLPQQNIRTLL